MFAGIAAAPSAADVLLSGGFTLYITSKLPDLQSTGKPDTSALLWIGLAFVVFLLVAMPILLGILGIGLGAQNYAALRVNGGEAVTIRVAYAYSFQHFWRNIGIIFQQMVFALVIPVAAFGILMVIGGVVIAALAGSAVGRTLGYCSRSCSFCSPSPGPS